jgi:hypothetical protein
VKVQVNAFALPVLPREATLSPFASSRRTEQERDYLQGLGADEIIDARELSGAGSRSDGSRIH